MKRKIYSQLQTWKANMVDALADQMFIGDNVFVEFKGALSEQFVMQQLTSMAIDILYFNAAENVVFAYMWLLKEKYAN